MHSKFSLRLILIVLFASLSVNLSCDVQTTSKKDSRTSISKEFAKTAHLKDDQKYLFSFLVIGDSRPIDAASPQPTVFLRLLNQMNKEKASFLLHTGDVVAGQTKDLDLYTKQYQEFLSIMNNLSFPFHLAIGNHDFMGSTGEIAFKKVLKRQLYYSFDYKNSHFIILNTELRGQEGKITGKQLEWLKENLNKSRGSKHLFVVMHRPLYSVLNPEGKRNRHLAFVDKKNEHEIRSLMLQYQVDAVFAGHEHLFNKQIHDGTVYIITGPAGASPYTDEVHGGFHSYIRVNVAGDNVNMEIIRLDGKIVNPDSIPKPLPR